MEEEKSSDTIFPQLGSLVEDINDTGVSNSKEQENGKIDGHDQVDQNSDENVNVINVTQGEVSIIESLCMNCQENGSTRLLFTQVPFFREIIISSFDCEHCHFSNNEVI